MCNPPLLSHFDALSSPSSSASHFTGRKVRRSYRSPMNKNDHGDEYFLNSCFLCKTHLHPNDDVYMYRGDVAFCSEECRQDQIDIDEAREKKWTKEKMLKQAKTTSKYQEIRVRAAGTVIA